MFQTLPFELLELIAFYLQYQDLYSSSKVDIRFADILSKTRCWVIKLPKSIDWSSPDAPKKYTPYDWTDFTIHYQDKEFRRGQGLVFSSDKIGGRRCIVSNHPNPIVLYRHCLVMDTEPKSISYLKIIHLICSPSGWVIPDKRGTRGCPAGERGERGLVGIKPRRAVLEPPESRWRSTQNIRIRGKRYETDFSLEFKTEPKTCDCSENDE